jgi:hypothetical protein
MDAAFWPDSIAGRAINALFTAGKPIVLEELTENEALRILARKRVGLGPAQVMNCHLREKER